MFYFIYFLNFLCTCKKREIKVSVYVHFKFTKASIMLIHTYVNLSLITIFFFLTTLF